MNDGNGRSAGWNGVAKALRIAAIVVMACAALAGLVQLADGEFGAMLWFWALGAGAGMVLLGLAEVIRLLAVIAGEAEGRAPEPRQEPEDPAAR